MSPLAGISKFGVCGTAFWAENVHLPALARHPAVELIGVWGRTEERVRRIADRFGIRAYTDYTSMLSEVDGVSFALPPAVQGRFALQAAREGKKLMLEKPPSIVFAEADQLLKEVEKRNLDAACFLTRRFIPELTHLIADAKKGCSTSGYAKLHLSPLASGSPYATSQWRHDADGALWDLGPHALTMLIDALGAVESVKATRRGAAIEASFVHVGGKTSTCDLSIHADPLDACELYEFSGPTGRIKGVKGEYDRLDTFDRAFNEVLEASSSERSSFQDAVEILRVLEVMSASIAKNVSIAL